MLCEHWGWQTASLTIVDCRALNLSKASWICFCICIARESVSLSLHFSGWKIQDTPYLWQSLSACWKSVFRRNLSVLYIAVRAAMERHGDQCDSRALKDTHKFLICCSFLEIYNEADTRLRIPCGFDDFDGFTLCPCLSVLHYARTDCLWPAGPSGQEYTQDRPDRFATNREMQSLRNAKEVLKVALWHTLTVFVSIRFWVIIR